MESKDYFDAVSVATNNAEKKTKTFMTPRVRLPTILYDLSHRTI